MTEQNTNGRVQRLKSFAVGDSLRLIQTDERLLNAYNFKTDVNLDVKINDGDLSGHYLMKDVKSVSLDRFFSNDFVEAVKENVNDNKSEVYYNTNAISLNKKPKKLVQNNEKSYIIDRERYADKDTSYALDQWKDKIYDNGHPLNYNAAAYSIISAFVSNNYNQKYFDASHYVNNKSVPIYRLNDSALTDLKYIRLYDKECIDNLLNKYDKVKQISGEVLFNSKSQENDIVNYDSILIDPIISVYAETFKENSFKSSVISSLFEDIFTHIPMESFYRFLNPVGVIEEVQMPCNNTNTGNKITQYSFSIDMKDKSRDPSINYFSLKNFKNPELYQDYEILSTVYDSVKSPNYVYKYNLISNIFKIYNEVVVNKLKDLIGSSDLDRISYDIIKGTIDKVGTHSVNDGVNVLDEVINIGHSYFTAMQRTTISDAFNAILYENDTYGIDLLRQSWNTFLKRHFKVKISETETEIVSTFFDSSANRYLLFEDDFVNEITESFAEFEKKLNEMLVSLGVHFTLDEILPAQTFTINIDGNRTTKTIRTFINFDDADENLEQKLSEILHIDIDEKLKTNIKMAKRYTEVIKCCQMFKNFIVNEQAYISEERIGRSAFVLQTSILQTIYNQIETCSKTSQNIHNNAIYDKLINDGLFKPGIYYKNLVSLMDEIAKINDADHVASGALMQLNYPEKYMSKMDDYKSTYEDMFERENEMTMSGILYGRRNYSDAFVNLGDDLNLVYNYDTRFDKNFISNESIIIGDEEYIGTAGEYERRSSDQTSQKIKVKEFLSSTLNTFIVIDKTVYEGAGLNSSNNMIQNDIKDIKLYAIDEVLEANNHLPAYIFGNNVRLVSGLTFIDYWTSNIRALSFKLKNFLNKSFNDDPNEEIDGTIECLLFRLTDDKMIITINKSVMCMLKMLNAMSMVDFVDNIKGQHYYKENNKQKSNVFSLNVRNSGLNYQLYSYDEMNIMHKDMFGADFDNDADALAELKLGAIHPNGKLPNLEKESDYKSYKYYSYDDDCAYTGRIISVKMELRKTFEDAIRKSIHRYIPVNTVLWKIDYTED